MTDNDIIALATKISTSGQFSPVELSPILDICIAYEAERQRMPRDAQQTELSLAPPDQVRYHESQTVEPDPEGHGWRWK